ncbi:D-alanyl-D-alanine carboxypeptidase family protein [Thermoanaerobacterium thermosaccharolyticum]|jgi:serine-type D-Ala-D-Ala carboxypeptidase (penicillin-binding protein 5/6)|uniref:D-alanyl-D-alanine carboxypeptidase family protein n=1 Tax=Thermoanaerobacterium thermosaccharolyticum TaxID=1517 RepID=UPI001785FE6E|nr:D-alanyl-D-alanine carboxypeptidase family protein [Thermoanaerobacterium thermosaccharolyticum]MBE0068125.1 D-alanyl-D-alanine carboxypeptidase [Thermoanaerobacterium thermosaccharolyticum]MBE0227868.1 D-alanyl-D-alanine carboxypeptidase [Thermoanaerobacterium thermosaccharolyticum]
MKKTLLFLLIFTFLMTPINVNAENIKPPQIASKAAIVMDQKSGRVLYEKNINEKLPMASTTKIMTLLLALEYGNLNDIVTVSKRAASVGGSSIWLAPGEKLSLIDLLYGLMLNSGNDAATAIAEHIGGSVEKFAEMMNKKAKDIGAYNTNFVTPSGLDIGINDHYTTAYDLALITRYAFNNYSKFAEIVSTKEKTIPWSGRDYDRYLRNKNKMLWQYEGGDGVKTGFTNKAGRCLVASATRDGHRLISVVLNSGPMWEDSQKILDYSFEKYKPLKIVSKCQVLKTISVINGKEKYLPLQYNDDFTLPVSKEEILNIKVEYNIPKSIKAPIGIGEKVGIAKVLLNDKQIVTIDVVAGKTIDERDYNYNLKTIIKNWVNIFQAENS